MSGVGPSVRVASVAVLIWGCGTSGGVDSGGGAGAGLGGSATGGAATGGSASGGSANGGSANGGATQSSGGEGAGETRQCKMVDGQLAYGPIGEPWPWPLEALTECPGCFRVRDSFGFRNGAGYGFVWSVNYETDDALAGNLYSMTVGPNFEGGEPSELIANNRASDLAVAPAPNGFAVTTCSPESMPEWIRLEDDLDPAVPPDLVASCGLFAPPTISTGQSQLTSFTDDRGLVVASLSPISDRVFGGDVLAADVQVPVLARFSRSGERVLFVFSEGSEKRGKYGVLDLQGKLVGAVQPYGEPFAELAEFAVVARRDGWWIVNESGLGDGTGAVLTGISGEGLVEQEVRVFEGSDVSVETFVPSAHGGSVLVGAWSETGQFAHSFALLALIDDAGKIVYSKETDSDSKAGALPLGVVVDPLRDLIVEERKIEGSASTMVIQEYGCLE